MDRQQLRATLLEMLEQETGEQYADLHEDTDLRQGLNLDSLDVVSLMLAIEGRLQVEIPTQRLTEVTTVGSLLDLIEAELGERRERKAA